MPRGSPTPQGDVGMVHPEQISTPSSRDRLREMKSQEYQTVLEFMQSKSNYRQFERRYVIRVEQNKN